MVTLSNYLAEGKIPPNAVFKNEKGGFDYKLLPEIEIAADGTLMIHISPIGKDSDSYRDFSTNYLSDLNIKE